MSLRCTALALALGLLVLACVSRPASAGWARTYGGPGTGEGIHALHETASGELIVLASTDSFGTQTGDAWLLRMDADGVVVARALAGNALPGGVDGGVALEDGGAVFAHRNVRDIFIRHDASVSRLAADGTVAWTTDISADPGRFFVNDIIAMSDGSFIGVGQSAMTDAGPHVGWAVAFDAAGAVLWQQYHGGVIDTAISFDCGIETSDGGFAVTGWMASGATGEDMFVAKLTSTGVLSWAATLGGTGGDRGASLVELPGGGFAIAGSTDSFTASGHAAWIVRVSAAGSLLWDVVLGADEWSDLQAITIADDGLLVAHGRISEPGFATNDLWALGIDPVTGAIAWQRAYEGTSGDHANDIASLSGGDLLLAGVWGWGFAEEDLWLLRTDVEGRIDSCPLVRDTTVTGAGAGIRARTQFLPPHPPLGSASPGTVVTDSGGITSVTQCEAAACPTLACGAIVADPRPACEGDSITLSIDIIGGTPPFVVAWDFDGDGAPDVSGNPVLVTLPPGTNAVAAVVRDSCANPLTCSSSADIEVRPAAPPAEVSDVRGGAPPLLVLDQGDRILFEELAGATAFSIHAGAIATWYAPGSSCFIATSPVGGGLLEATPVLGANTWFVVTASNRCSEGSAGGDSFAVERMSVGAWTPCGGGP